jgi:hypothetical protein
VSKVADKKTKNDQGYQQHDKGKRKSHVPHNIRKLRAHHDEDSVGTVSKKNKQKRLNRRRGKHCAQIFATLR